MLQEWVTVEAARLRADAELYDGLALKNRAVANCLDLVLGVLAVAIGTNGVAGALVTPWEDLSAAMVAVTAVQLVAALITVYVQVYRPREKEILYCNTSAGNAAVARAAEVAADLGDGVPADTMVKTIIHSLEASLQDDNPLIKKKKV